MYTKLQSLGCSPGGNCCTSCSSSTKLGVDFSPVVSGSGWIILAAIIGTVAILWSKHQMRP